MEARGMIQKPMWPHGFLNVAVYIFQNPFNTKFRPLAEVMVGETITSLY
jgi:hypothetical protein